MNNFFSQKISTDDRYCAVTQINDLGFLMR